MAVGARDYIDKLLVKKYADEKVDNHERSGRTYLKIRSFGLAPEDVHTIHRSA